MKKIKDEQKFYGTKDNFRRFLKDYNFRKISSKYDNTNSIFINTNCTIVRAYVPAHYEEGKREICWRYIPYDVTTCITNAGYKLISIHNKQYTMHRIMAETFVYNEDPEHLTEVDHIDGNKLNNRPENLRWVTKTENMQRYFTKKRAKEASGETGVNAFIKELKEQYVEYIPAKKLYLNIKKKEN